MVDLDKIKIVYSPLTERIKLARFGKQADVALDTRDAMNDFLQALVAYSFDGKMPEVGDKREIDFGGGDEQFIFRIERKQTND